MALSRISLIDICYRRRARNTCNIFKSLDNCPNGNFISSSSRCLTCLSKIQLVQRQFQPGSCSTTKSPLRRLSNPIAHPRSLQKPNFAFASYENVCSSRQQDDSISEQTPTTFLIPKMVSFPPQRRFLEVYTKGCSQGQSQKHS